MTSLLLALAKKKPEVDVSAHLEVATQWLWVGFALIVLFFLLRPELWRRIWFDRVDPRPAALARMAIGITILWTFMDLLVLQGEWLFTDQGLLLTEMSRKNYGGKLRTLWDPEFGVEHWWDWLTMLTDRWSVLFFRSDPAFTYTIFGLLFFCAFMMTIGAWTRIFTVLTWLMVLQVYNYNPIYFSGGDTVVRITAFLAIFVNWGKAYSVDSWRKRRKAILKDGAKEVPAYERIAAWPKIFFLLQLTFIYCATGLLKSGKTWADGSALYYALNLDHFYRWPMHLVAAWGHKLYITRAMTVLVHWWEMLFPLYLLGEMLRGWDKDREQNRWQGPVPRWSLYALGMAVCVLLVWNAPMWVKPMVLLVLAGIIAADRLWLGEADLSGRGSAAWTIRVLSWGALIGVLAVGAYMADLSVLYYYTPGKKSAPWLHNKDMLRQLASLVILSVPLLLCAVVMALRQWMPKTYVFVRDWLLGKRLWLLLGFLFHVGIDISLNVGTFVQGMIAMYPILLVGANIDSAWKFLLWRAAAPGEGDRPALPEAGVRRIVRKLTAPLERAKYRIRKAPWVVVHGPSEGSIRRVALLRCWDLGERLDFELDTSVGADDLRLRLRTPDKDETMISGKHPVGRQLISLFPGLWWLWPISFVPGVGNLALAILRQRA